MSLTELLNQTKNHPNVLHIKNKFDSDLNSFNFQQTKAPEVKKIEA